jgi:TPR repeat protein
MRRSILVILGLLLGLAPAARAEVHEAWRAYRAGAYASALETLLPLAEAGDAEAQYDMGTLYCDGLAVERNYRQAAEWYSRAAEQGHKGAQFTLGFLAYHGAGRGEEDGAVARDPIAAARWLKPAAERDSAMAQYLLASLYRKGEGVPQDEDKALRWALAAAEQGVAGAQYEAALLLGSRAHAWASWVEAYKWFLLAARQGYPGARQNLDILAKRLNLEEIAQAKAEADAWRPAK